jgi:hypothetical protein
MARSLPVLMLLHTLCALSLSAQTPAPPPSAPPVEIREHQTSGVAADARFELLQSALTAKLTLRIDRYTGFTWQMVLRPDSAVGWAPMLRLSHAEPDTRLGSRVNYQVFTSGLGLSFTFLMNVQTGATWQLKEDPKQGWYWDPIS